MNFDLVIPDWLSPYLPIIGGVVRGIIQIASASGFVWATAVTGDQITMIVTAIAMTITLGWSAWQKVQAQFAARKAEVAAAAASAVAGQAVTVIVTAPGEPNTAKLVPKTELASVPTVGVAELKKVIEEKN